MSTRIRRVTSAIALVLCAYLTPNSITFAETAAPEDKPVQAVIEEYCTAVSDEAGEQRIAREKQSLNELQLKVEKRLNDLEKAKNDLQEQLDRREELRNLATTELVEIYAGMDPAAAAAQMDKVDTRLASSILRQLKPRVASAILDEMEPDLAARLVRYIAVATTTDEASN
jgi:flagellar motility protein MotE (MotC chaperone)